MTTKRGILIAFEGIDGAGKTTQVNRLSECLKNAGEVVVVSKEPTDGQWGKQLRSSATTGRLPLEEELDLFIRDRKDHIANLIAPALAAGNIVILDRYFYSTIAYQGSRGADPRSIESSMVFAPVPDMTFLLDASPTVTLDRIRSGRNETPNEFEKLETLEACRVIFQGLASERPEVFSIDASQSANVVEREIINLLLSNALKTKRCAKSYECDVFYCAFRDSGACQWSNIKSKISRYNRVSQ